MLKCRFFIGKIIDFELISPHDPLRRLLIMQTSDRDLQTIIVEGITYIGKFIDPVPVDIQQMDMLGDHLVSILKQLWPAQSFSRQNLRLLTLPETFELTNITDYL